MIVEFHAARYTFHVKAVPRRVRLASCNSVPRNRTDIADINHVQRETQKRIKQ